MTAKKPRKSRASVKKSVKPLKKKCGIDLSAIEDDVCALESIAPSLNTSSIAVLEFTKQLAKRLKKAKIPVTVWLDDEICDGIELGFASLLRQGNIPCVKATDGACVPKKHDSTLPHYRCSSIPLHHADPAIQVAAMHRLHELLTLVLEEAEGIAAVLDDARSFCCDTFCCPFSSKNRKPRCQK